VDTELILEKFQQEQLPRPEREWARLWGIGETEYDAFCECVDKMCLQGLLVRTKAGNVATPEMLGLKAGRLQSNVRGFGFFIPDDPQIAELHIAEHRLGGAVHNDRVLAHPVGIPGEALFDCAIRCIACRCGHRHLRHRFYRA